MTDSSVQRPTIRRIVEYRSRTGAYTCPAIITATTDSLNPLGVKLYLESGGTKGVPPLESRYHVHLTVFTPGLPGMRATADDFVGERADAPISENVAGCYQEWDVPYGPVQQDSGDHAPGTWNWGEVAR